MSIKKTILRSRDLNCPSCVAKIERELLGIDGVDEAKVFFASGRIEVVHDPQRADAARLVDAVGRVGYTAKVSAL